MTDFESKWLSPRRKYSPNKLTIIFNRKTYDEFKQSGRILEENEVAIIDMSNGEKITVIGDGKTPAVDCRRIDFPYIEIVAERDHKKGRYICRFVDKPKRSE